MLEFEFLSPEDKSAILAISTDEVREQITTILRELGYKIHSVPDEATFHGLFVQTQYDVTVVEELFCASSHAENGTLASVQAMPMNQRRHTTIILVGPSFQTLNAMQAYQQSVHLVLNSNDLDNSKAVLEKTINENQYFLKAYMDVLNRLATGDL